MNKFKIINDPVHGMVRFNAELLYDIIDHRYFQRLRRIKQMGLSNLVYPSANHTRFEHAIGAMHLMTRALDVLRAKGVEIDDKEYLACCVAILCHDIGHGPYSHALEYDLLPISHEEVSLILIQDMKATYGDALDLAVEIFKGVYSRSFLCDLVSSQLDVDRLDYLTRDSFFSGVIEGKVGYDRIIMMLNVKDDQLVIEEKGVASVEKFLLSRHLMYSQVYLHKTALVAEKMLKLFMKRAIKCHLDGNWTIKNENISRLVENKSIAKDDLYQLTTQYFTKLDDADIMQILKKSQDSSDFVLKLLSKGLLQRNLFKLYLHTEKNHESRILEVKNALNVQLDIDFSDVNELFVGVKSNLSIYSKSQKPINILLKSGEIKELSEIAVIPSPNYVSQFEYTIGPRETNLVI